MSASSTPTVRPRAARAAARLTVTEDLPTPPFPDEMATTRVVPGMSVSGAFSRTFQRALAMRADFSSLLISLVRTLTLVTPEAADTVLGVALQLSPQRAAGGGEGDVDG